MHLTIRHVVVFENSPGKPTGEQHILQLLNQILTQGNQNMTVVTDALATLAADDAALKAELDQVKAIGQSAADKINAIPQVVADAVAAALAAQGATDQQTADAVNAVDAALKDHLSETADTLATLNSAVNPAPVVPAPPPAPADGSVPVDPVVSA